jgi:hypothetical protein
MEREKERERRESSFEFTIPPLPPTTNTQRKSVSTLD